MKKLNKELAQMLSEEVLRLIAESNNTLTINQALNEIVLQYKKSQGLENKTNLSLHYKDYVFKIGDKFKHQENGIIGTIVKIDNDLINLSQHSDEYGYYPNITISANVLADLVERENLIRAGD